MSDWLEGLRVFDVSNPLRLGELGVSSSPAAQQLAVFGDWVFATNEIGSIGVIDVSDPCTSSSFSFGMRSGSWTDGLEICLAGRSVAGGPSRSAER